MSEVIFLYVLALVWILFASLQDLRRREVYNWISFSLVIFALGFRFFYSFFSDSVGFGFFWQGLIGLVIFIVIGNLLYYGRMFAGGDAKLMMALGAVLPLSTIFYTNLEIYISFIFIFLLAGALYGLFATFRLSLKNFSEFKKDFKNRIRNKKGWFYGLVGLGFVLVLLGIVYQASFILFGIFVAVFPYLYFYARSVDKTCIIRRVKISEISEGEWIAENIKLGTKTIKPSWDGLSSVEIKAIKKKYKTILIKQGIPFVPVFLIAFVVFLYLWNLGLWNAFW